MILYQELFLHTCFSFTDKCMHLCEVRYLGLEEAVFTCFLWETVFIWVIYQPDIYSWLRELMNGADIYPYLIFAKFRFLIYFLLEVDSSIHLIVLYSEIMSILSELVI